MNNTPPDNLQPAQPASERSSTIDIASIIGITSCIFGLLAILVVATLIFSSFSLGNRTSGGNNIIDILRLPYITFFLILFGVGLGIISIAINGIKEEFGMLGLFMSGLAIFFYCFIFGFISFFMSGGFGG